MSIDWPEWMETHRKTLKAIGLPCDVYMTAEHWFDFLTNGHLHWHPHEDAGFDLSDLNEGQARHLLRFLDAQSTDSEMGPFMKVHYTRADPALYSVHEWLRRRFHESE